jgi:dynactin-5
MTAAAAERAPSQPQPTAAEGEGGCDRSQEDEQDEEDNDDYMLTVSHCYLSHRAVLESAGNIEFKGRAVIQRGCTLRGGSGIIRLGRYVWLHPGSTFQPGLASAAPQGTGEDAKQRPKSVPMAIGSHTVVERDCQIRAAAVGSYCWIGKRVTLGQRVIIKDCCVVMDDVVLGDDTVIPPFTLVRSTVPAHYRRRGRPAPSASGSAAATTTPRERGSVLLPVTSFAPAYECTELPPSTAAEMQERSLEKYATLAASRAKRS